MNNLQKIGRLFNFFSSCDWWHNNNLFKLEALDNGFLLEIEFADYNSDKLEVDFNFSYNDEDVILTWRDGIILHVFIEDYEKLDKIFDIIFSKVIKTDIEKLEADIEKNSLK